MVKSSFFTDGEAYTEAVAEAVDTVPSTGVTDAPSSMYPNGDIYVALSEESTVVAEMTALEHQAAMDAASAAASASSAAAHDASSATHDTSATAAASAAATSASSAATSATNAGNSATAAASSASAASTSATNAGNSATSASGSASAASGSASSASSSASAASTSASNAATSASNAHTSELNAASSASSAATSAANAAAAVSAAAGTSTPAMDGTAAVGTGTKWAHEDHVHPTDTSRAPLASPAFTGNPTAPTQTVGDNSTKLATTAFVLANGGGLPASATPLMDGTAAVGTATKYAREDHVHPTNTALAPFEAQAFNNIIINGGMEVDQANAGGSVTVSAGYITDQWFVAKNGTMVCTAQQVADAPPSFTNSLKITVGTAEASLGSGDYTIIQQYIEGFRTSKLAFGSAGAQTVTLGFWTKIHRTGTYSGSLKNSANNRCYPFTFTQNVADTWEYKTVTIAGDTTGTWVGNTNGIGLSVVFAVASGSTYLQTAGAWSGAGNYVGATGTTNGVAATTDVFQITGVSLLPGSVAVSAANSPLLKRPFDQELQLCKRYFQKIGGDAANDAAVYGYALSGAAVSQMFTYPVQMRVIPTLAFQGTWSFGNSSSTTSYVGTSAALVQVIASTASSTYYLNSAGAYIKLDARI